MEPPAAWEDANSAQVRITECRGARFWSRSMLPTTSNLVLNPRISRCGTKLSLNQEYPAYVRILYPAPRPVGLSHALD